MGADPVFVDIDPHSLNMDATRVADVLARDPAIRAVIPVHIGGLACDMTSIMSAASEHGVLVVEDAAHALPTTWEGKTIGSIGNLTVFSFYVTKPLATGEGGMVVTDDPGFADRIKTMRLHGISRHIFDRYTTEKPSWYYEVVAPGFKYNMPDTSAAIGIPQLGKAHAFRDRREEIACRYSEALSDQPLKLPAVGASNDLHAWHLYIIRLQLEHLSITRDQFVEQMTEHGIGVSVHFIPLHFQPYWRETYRLNPGDFTVAGDMFERVVSLPIYPKMLDADVDRVIATVRNILGRTAI